MYSPNRLHVSLRLNLSLDKNQFLELVNGKLKGKWIEVSTATGITSTNARYADDNDDYVTNLVIRMNYLKVLQNCKEVLQIGEALVVCKIN